MAEEVKNINQIVSFLDETQVLIDNNIKEVSGFLGEVNKLINDNIQSVTDFLGDKEITYIAQEYAEHKTKKEDLGFNIFNLISHNHYHENYHSDIIKAFLDTKGKHGEGAKFLKLFIAHLNSILSKDNKRLINESDYDGKVETDREKGKIDIPVLAGSNAIIIENKINNAGDTIDGDGKSRQLPKYYKRVTEEWGYNKDKIDAIVYIPLDINKEPYKKDWTEEEKTSVDKILIILPAYNPDTKKDLYTWVKACEATAQNIDVFCILRQYGKLIRQIGENNMSNLESEKFWGIISKDSEKYKAAQAVAECFEYLPTFFQSKIFEKYQDNHTPFEGFNKYQNWDVYFHSFKLGNSSFKFDCYLDTDKFKIEFFDDNFLEENNQPNPASKLLEELKIKFSLNGNHCFITFSCPTQESDFFNFIDDFLEKLKNYKKIPQSINN